MATHKRPKYTLEELIAKCDPNTPIPKELADWDNISPVGKEVIETAIKDNPELSWDFIKGILVGLEEIKNGNVSAYKFGFDDTEYLLRSSENAKRLNRSIEQIEETFSDVIIPSLSISHDKTLEAIEGILKIEDVFISDDLLKESIEANRELTKLTIDAKASIKRASESIERGIDDAESFLCTRANDEDVVHVTTVIKDGDDLIITIPDDIINAAGLKIGDKVNIEIDKHGYGFVITHAK